MFVQRSCSGLVAVAGVVVIGYLLPALLSGRPPVTVTIAAAVPILIVMLLATHGISMRTAVAVVGALASAAVESAPPSLTSSLSGLLTSAAPAAVKPAVLAKLGAATMAAACAADSTIGTNSVCAPM